MMGKRWKAVIQRITIKAGFRGYPQNFGRLFDTRAGEFPEFFNPLNSQVATKFDLNETLTYLLREVI